MSAIEKLFIQIFEKKKRIIDQAHRQCHLFDQHLVSKLLIDGIIPPPWLSNPMLASLNSDPKDLNEDDLIFGALFSTAQSTIPISDRRCSLQGNVVATTHDDQRQSGLHGEFHVLNRDIDAGDRLSNLPDCSVNNVGRSSISAAEMESAAISPQIQMESRIPQSYNDPALSLAKLQRSKSRQRALELRHSAKAAKSCFGDDNNTSVCAGGKTGSATSSPQLGRFEGSGLANASNTNIQGCAAEEVERGECLTQRNDQSNCSRRVTRSRSLALKLNSSNVVSSSEVEDGPESNNVIQRLEPINAPCFSNGSCEAKETNKGDYQRRVTENNAFSKRVTRSRSTSQTKCDNELLELESALAGGNGVELLDSLQPVVNGGLTLISKTRDHENECQRKATKDGDCCSDKQESNVKIRRLPGSFCQSPIEDVFMHGGSLKSIGKSIQSPQPSVSQHSQLPAMAVVGSFRCEEDPDLCALKVKTNEGKSKSVSNIFVDRSSTCSHSTASNRYPELEGTEIVAGRTSTSEKDCKFDTEIAAAASCGNTRAVATSTTEGSLRPVNSSYLDSRNSGRRPSTLNKSLLEKSLRAETVVAKKSMDTRENIISGANVTHNIDDRSAGTLTKVAAEFDVLVDKHNASLGSSPKVGLDVSVSRPPPSNFVLSVKPKQLDFDNVAELSMNGIPGADQKAGQDVPPDKGTLTMLEPGCLDNKLTSRVFHEKCNFSMDTQLLVRQEVTVREDGPQMKSCESHLEEIDAAGKPRNVMTSKSQSFVVQESCPHTSIGSQNLPSSTNRKIPSQTAGQNSSGSSSKEAMATKLSSENIYGGGDECGSRIMEDTCSTAVKDSDLLGNAAQSVNNLAVGSAAAMGESNISLTNPVASSGVCLHQNNSLSGGKWINDEKDVGFSKKFQIVKNSTGSVASDMEHSCPQHKRRKTESHAERSLTSSPSHLEKLHGSNNTRLVSGNFNIKEDNREASIEVQYLTSHQEDMENSHVNDSTAEEMQNTKGYNIIEGSSLDKMNLDGRDRSGNTLLSFTSNGLGESVVPCLTEQGSSNSYYCLTAQKLLTNSCGFGIGSSKRCTAGKNLDAEGSSSGRIYPEETAMLLEGSSVSQGIQHSDLIGANETVPEMEGFIIQPDKARPCTDGDQIELEKLNLSSDTDEYASILKRLGSSTFLHSPLCSSSNPYRLHKIPDLYRSLPNGLVEGMMDMRTSLPVNSESGKSFSDCLPNCKTQSTWDIKKACVSPIQTLWDRINSKYGSSGKRESSIPELPCIDEENEAADEIATTFQNRIRPERTTVSITREPLAEITDNAKPSFVSQDDILAEGCGLDSVAREFSFCGTNNQEKQKLEKGSAGRRRFTGKGKENQNLSRGASHARRTAESLRNRSSRPKLSGKNSMNKGPTYPGGKSSCSNIVSNVTSFIPLVQQKQAAEVITGKRDIKVKALEAAEAAKRIAEKKENERKMKKEALRLERERMEQDNKRQLELQNRKKEEERKKREAEIAAKKRQREEEERIEKERKRKRVEEAKQREEEERNEKERKRKRVEEARRKHQEREKICAKKEEKGTKCCDAVDGKNESKECTDGREKCKNLENDREGNMNLPLAETPTSKNPSVDETKESETNKEMVIGHTIKRTGKDDLIIQNTIEEQSYDISPYKGSDDEEEDDDDSADTDKFVPSWASKQRLYVAVSSQRLVDPETIFPLQSFCNISEVLLPRRLQGK
ncbi:uncharacterized protein LOC129288421 isoform X2 [Prosopis cineraria]|uniref:uncharacterized protein LOC129288421 isoform X2 n=1 Tax=Prosopis cineraria TaxID=364024 RepID=UPI002410A44E|nr:uncharacterized protein LOC129288421 isoform X2 [Prosopis cineraria]